MNRIPDEANKDILGTQDKPFLSLDVQDLRVTGTISFSGNSIVSFPAEETLKGLRFDQTGHTGSDAVFANNLRVEGPLHCTQGATIEGANLTVVGHIETQAGGSVLADHYRMTYGVAAPPYAAGEVKMYAVSGNKIRIIFPDNTEKEFVLQEVT